jgi:hypothetical protein
VINSATTSVSQVALTYEATFKRRGTLSKCVCLHSFIDKPPDSYEMRQHHRQACNALNFKHSTKPDHRRKGTENLLLQATNMVRRKHKFGSPYLSNQPNQPTQPKPNQTNQPNQTKPTNRPTWRRVPVEKLTGAQLVKKPLHCIEPEESVPHLNQPAIHPYSEPV